MPIMLSVKNVHEIQLQEFFIRKQKITKPTNNNNKIELIKKKQPENPHSTNEKIAQIKIYKKSLWIFLFTLLKHSFLQTKHIDEKLLQVKKLIVVNHNNHTILRLHSDECMCKYL